jgi:hypothetical protein
VLAAVTASSTQRFHEERRIVHDQQAVGLDLDQADLGRGLPRDGAVSDLLGVGREGAFGELIGLSHRVGATVAEGR